MMDRLVFADLSNKEARTLGADAFEQMGYTAEAAPWRNAYLLAAQKLRGPASAPGRPTPGISPEILHAMTASELFDYLGTRIDGPRAAPTKIAIAWRFSDTKEILAATLSHGALTVVRGKVDGEAAAMVETSRRVLEPVILGQKTLADAMKDGGIKVVGDAKSLTDFWALLVDFRTGIPLALPR